MDEDQKFASIVTALIVIGLVCIAAILLAADLATTKRQLEVDKAAIASGMCQELNGTTNYPGYHWVSCKK